MIKLNSVLLIVFVVLVEFTSHLTPVHAQGMFEKLWLTRLSTDDPPKSPFLRGTLTGFSPLFKGGAWGGSKGLKTRPRGDRTLSDTSQIASQINPTLEVASDPPQPPKRGTPDDREPAGTRGSCEETNTLFTPLLPVTDSGFSGFTLTGYPTFWFYVSYKPDSVSSGKFVLKQRDGKVVYRTLFKLPKTPGFVSVSIPTTATPLEKNKEYVWKFVLNCASQNSAQPPSVYHEGLVQRVDRAEIESQLRIAKLPERIKLYVDNKIWYDASSDLASIHEIPEAWLNLLKAIGLEELRQKAIAGSVVLIEN